MGFPVEVGVGYRTFLVAGYSHVEVGERHAVVPEVDEVVTDEVEEGIEVDDGFGNV